MRGWMRLTREDGRLLRLSLPQVVLLHGLRRMGKIPTARWAGLVGASPSTATGLLDGLESAGLVLREHDRRDRRRVLVSLTPKGEQVADRLRQRRMRAWKEMCRDLPSDRLRVTATTLTTLSERLGPGRGASASLPTDRGRASS